MSNDYKYTTRRLNELLAKTQNKTYFVGFATLIFIIVMTLIGILPAYSAFTFQSEENSRRAVLAEKLNKKLQISKNLALEYKEKANLIKYFDYIFPSIPNQGNIIDLLNSNAISNNVLLTRIIFSDKPSQTFTLQNFEPQIKSQQVGVNFKGSKSSLLNVVKNIEESRRIFNILTFSLDKIVDSNEVSLGYEFSLNIQLEYYYYLSNSENL